MLSIKQRLTAMLIACVFLMSLAPAGVLAAAPDVTMRNIEIQGYSMNFILDFELPGNTAPVTVEISWKETNSPLNAVSKPLTPGFTALPVSIDITPGNSYDIVVYYSYMENNTLKYANKPFSNVTAASLFSFAKIDVLSSSLISGAALSTSYNNPTTYIVTESGFLYSTSVQTPESDTQSGVIKLNNTHAGFTPTSITASIGTLDFGRIYYIRAYVKYNDGTTDKFAYSDVMTYTAAPIGAPTVTTTSAVKTGNAVYARGAVTTTGSSTLTEYGFVYSLSNPEPNLESGTRVDRMSQSNTSFDASITVSGSMGFLYVRAYAKNNHGTAYGSVISVNLAGEGQNIFLLDERLISAESAQFTILVPQQDLGQIIERGVVLAQAPENVPRIDGGLGHIIVNADKATGKPDVGEVTVDVDGLKKDTQYYIRAYLKTSMGTYYSSAAGISFTTEKEDIVATLPVTNITNTTASASGKVSEPDYYVIQGRGVVYSSVNKTPEITNSEVAAASGTEAGEFTVSLTNLRPDTVYYVRAYCLIGGKYEYGSTRTFSTLENTYLTIDELTDITSGGATVKATVSGIAGTVIAERGIVYSDTYSSPNTSNASILKADTGLGTFEAALTNLKANTVYHIRAYAKDSAGNTYYSTAREFTTADGFTLAVTYVTSSQQFVGSQNIDVSLGAVLNASSFTPPEGYSVPDGFTYTVTNATMLTVTVQLNASVERPYVKGMGNFTFEPETPMLRLDVAKMIYNILGEGKEYASAITFTDMPTDYESINAINFCTSRGIIVGFGDNTFQPNGDVTRAQIAVMINKAFNFQPDNSVSVDLVDISEHWGRTQIAIAVQNNYIAGYRDKTFRPNLPVTRAEAVTMMSRAATSAIGRSLEPLGTVDFTDVPSGNWAYVFIMNAAVPEP